MASTRGHTLPQFSLTPQQQNLLFRALTSNQPATNESPEEASSLSPQSLTTSPAQNQNNSGLDLSEGQGLQESPFVDYDYDFGPDSGFDFDFHGDSNAKMIGDLPGSAGSESSKDDSKSSSPENENSDKRGHPDDDDDDDFDEGGGKRREGEGKVPKKPGRKPLTNEPSSKRKAQNRAAQRAFRERKERHLKDLETKVEELEKASNATNNENSQLKSQIEKLTVELSEYKKRVSLLGNVPRVASTGSRNQPLGFGALQNLSDVNFQFEFPKFGALPTPQNGANSNANNNAKRAATYPSPSSSNTNGQNSPQEKSRDKTTPNSTKGGESSDVQRKEASAKASTSFNNVSPYENTHGSNASRSSLDSTTFSVNGAAGASPSSSSNSNMGASSSCGTSPEPFTQSPVGFKPMDTLTTIGEEQPSLTSDHHTGFGSSFGNIDFGNLDWLSQQNGGQFDPQLFGDYREPQNSVLANTTFDDTFFNDAFDVDFTTPFNAAPSPKPAKKNICDEIDAQKEKDDMPVATLSNKLLTCNNIWEKLQTCPKVHNGEIDLDGLCSDLQKKAKCGGTGAVVDEHDFKAIMTRYLGEDAANCPSSS